MEDLISAASRNHRKETIIHSYFTELEQVEYMDTCVWGMAVWLVTLTQLQNFRVLPTVVKHNYGITLHWSIWNRQSVHFKQDFSENSEGRYGIYCNFCRLTFQWQSLIHIAEYFQYSHSQYSLSSTPCSSAASVLLLLLLMWLLMSQYLSLSEPIPYLALYFLLDVWRTRSCVYGVKTMLWTFAWAQL